MAASSILRNSSFASGPEREVSSEPFCLQPPQLNGSAKNRMLIILFCLHLSNALGLFESSPGTKPPQYTLLLMLSSINGTFTIKSLRLPFYPEVLRLGRQTTSKAYPAPDNGLFDSKVLSRSHAEVWADLDTGRVWIKDCKSSNGTYVNSVRLGDEKAESEPHEIHKNDIIELGIDIDNDGTPSVHRKIAAKVDRILVLSQDTASEAKELQQYQPKHQTQHTQQHSQGDRPNGILSMGRHRGPMGASRASHPTTETLDAVLFGDLDASLEDLTFTHARSSTSGQFMNASIASASTLELVVRRLVAQIDAAKADSHTVQKLHKLLEEIKANQQETRFLGDQLPCFDEFKDKVESLTLQLEEVKKESLEKTKHIEHLQRALTSTLELRQSLPNQSLSDRYSAKTKKVENADKRIEREQESLVESVSDSKVQTLPQGPEFQEPLKSHSSAKTQDVEKLQAALAELETTKTQLAQVKNHARAAEVLVIKQARRINELTESLPTRDNQAVASPDVMNSIPISRALGVIVIGMGFLAVLNSVMRSPVSKAV